MGAQESQYTPAWPGSDRTGKLLCSFDPRPPHLLGGRHEHTQQSQCFSLSEKKMAVSSLRKGAVDRDPGGVSDTHTLAFKQKNGRQRTKESSRLFTQMQLE